MPAGRRWSPRLRVIAAGSGDLHRAQENVSAGVISTIAGRPRRPRVIYAGPGDAGRPPVAPTTAGDCRQPGWHHRPQEIPSAGVVSATAGGPRRPGLSPQLRVV